MQSIISQLRQYHQYFNPPANQAQLNRLTNYLLRPKMTFPRDLDNLSPLFDGVLDLYRDHNGIPIYPGISPFPIRLMSVEEADAQNISMHNLKWKRPNQFLLWYDDESNYCGVYLDEPLVGCVFFLHHDEPIDIPCFRNVREFYEALLAVTEANANREHEDDNRLYWWDVKTTLPKIEADPASDDDDLVIARHYKSRSENATDPDLKQYYAWIALNFYPVSAREEMENLVLTIEDMYVEEHAIDIFAKRKDSATIPTIEHLIVTGGGGVNTRSAGIRALGDIGGDEAIDALIRLIKILDSFGGQNFEPYLLSSLEKTGVETKRSDDGALSYRLNSTDNWTAFGKPD